MSRLYCGTSGWIYKDWRSRFYPEDLPENQWLAYYSSKFDTVEINNSFYRLPERATFERWRDESPNGFTFSLKASRYLTHMKKLKDPEDPLQRILNNSAGLEEKRGPILYQFPPYWHVNFERLEAFLKILPKDIRHAFEFRDESWQCDEVWQMLKQYNGAYCIMDAPGLPLYIKTTADFSYIRMHYGKDNGNYPDTQLSEWANTVEKLLKLGDVYIYFNNDQYGYALNNAKTMLRLLQAI
ncbi:MAG: DUF72 domain-containing protein [Armatimonadetes bacterium]|nr:DUF72 domain-containing protein [Armatimonadota bacterium]